MDNNLEVSREEADNYWGSVTKDAVTAGEEETKQYIINMDEVKTLDDVLLIIEAMNLHILAKPDGTGQFANVFHLLKEA